MGFSLMHSHLQQVLRQSQHTASNCMNTYLDIDSDMECGSVQFMGANIVEHWPELEFKFDIGGSRRYSHEIQGPLDSEQFPAFVFRSSILHQWF